MIATAATIKIEPGIYRNVPDAEYRQMDALSNSDLVAWVKPRDIDPKTAEFGSAFHAAVLEPEVAREKIVALEPRQKRSDYGVTDDKWVMTNSDYRKLVGMVDAVKQHPTLGKLLEMARAQREQCEVVAVWRDPEFDVLCKAKLDFHTDDWLYDWKTTGSDPDSFAQSVGAFAYHLQAAHYLAGARACGLEVKGFRFACACKRPDKGHVCWLYELEESWMVAGLQERRRLMTLYTRYANQEQPNENI